jgi:hypothetical protein
LTLARITPNISYIQDEMEIHMLRLEDLPKTDQSAIRKALAGDFAEYHYFGLGGAPSTCGVCYAFNDTAAGRAVACVVTELPDNPGTSVTNYAAQLATELYETLRDRMRVRKLQPDTIRFYECYPASRERGQMSIGRIDFTIVHRLERTVFTAPSWQHIQTDTRGDLGR